MACCAWADVKSILFQIYRCLIAHPRSFLHRELEKQQRDLRAGPCGEHGQGEHGQGERGAEHEAQGSACQKEREQQR